MTRSSLNTHILRDSGYTLVELMIAIAIGTIIIGATYSIYITQQRTFAAQDQVAELNATSKIALDIAANDFRETGFGVPEAGTYNINGFTTIFTTTDSSTTYDAVTIVGGFRRIGTLCSNGSGADTSPNDKTVVLVKAAGETTLDVNTSDRRNISFTGLTNGTITAVAGNTVTLLDPIGRAYPKYSDLNGNGACDDGEGVPVYVVEDYTFRVVGADLQRVRRLNGGSPETQVIAENVEDFQVAYGVDTNDDSVVDQFRYSPPGNQPLLSTDKVYSVRLNILARTARPDQNFQGQGNPPNPIENRNNHNTATNDSLRRRWWQMTVDLRNPVF